jgi:hypothetical protein
MFPALSLVLVAGGAILIWGVDAEVAGVDLDVIGWIGIVVGIVGALLSMLLYARDRGPEERVVRRDVVER